MTKLIVFLVVIPTSAALAFAPYEYAVTGVRSDNVLVFETTRIGFPSLLQSRRRN